MTDKAKSLQTAYQYFNEAKLQKAFRADEISTIILKKYARELTLVSTNTTERKYFLPTGNADIQKKARRPCQTTTIALLSILSKSMQNATR